MSRLRKSAWCVLQLLVEQWQAFLNSFVDFPETAIVDQGIGIDSIKDIVTTSNPGELSQVQLFIYWFYYFVNVRSPPLPALSHTVSISFLRAEGPDTCLCAACSGDSDNLPGRPDQFDRPNRVPPRCSQREHEHRDDLRAGLCVPELCCGGHKPFRSVCLALPTPDKARGMGQNVCFSSLANTRQREGHGWECVLFHPCKTPDKARGMGGNGYRSLWRLNHSRQLLPDPHLPHLWE